MARKRMIHIKNEDGQICLMDFDDVVKHNDLIMQDNIFFGLKSGYSEEEIKEYQRSASKKLSQLRKAFKENPGIVLRFDKMTETFVLDDDLGKTH